MKWTNNQRKTRNYFYFKLGFSDKAYLKVIDAYGAQVFHEMKVEPTNASLCDKIQDDWNSFMQVWGIIKDKFKDEYFQNKVWKGTQNSSRRKGRYNDREDFSDMLQYTNGSADDF